MRIDLTRPSLASLLDMPPTITVPETAAILGVSDKALFEALARGESPVKTIRVGRRVLVPVPSLLAVLGVDVEVLDALRRVFDRTRAASAARSGRSGTEDAA